MIRLALLALALVAVVGCGREAAQSVSTAPQNAGLPDAAAAPGWALDADIKETGR